MTLQAYLSELSEKLPLKISMDFPMPDLSGYIPAELDLISTLKFLAMFAAGFLILGILGRMLLGRRSGANRALSSAVGIASGLEPSSFTLCSARKPLSASCMDRVSAV